MNEFQTKLAHDMYELDRAILTRAERRYHYLRYIIAIDIIMGCIGITLTLMMHRFFSTIFCGVLVTLCIAYFIRSRHRLEQIQKTTFSLPDNYVTIAANKDIIEQRNLALALQPFTTTTDSFAFGPITNTRQMDTLELTLRRITDDRMKKFGITSEDASHA